VSSAPQTYTTQIADHAAPHRALVGTPLGRRERAHGNLRTIADITIAEVIEPVADLAVADRVAWVLAHRSGSTHLVIATDHTYLVVTSDVPLDGADATLIAQPADAPRIISLATPSGIVPMLTTLTIPSN
jgi:hypothetical protein